MPLSPEDFDLSSFWDNSDFASSKYLDNPLSDDLLAAVEADLGYKLPETYVALMRHRNGGMPVYREHRTPSPTSWAKDHIAITGIFGIGFQKGSLASSMGSKFWIEEWGYPAIGVYFADCPSAEHEYTLLGLSSLWSQRRAADCARGSRVRLSHHGARREL